jgi:chromate reductase
MVMANIKILAINGSLRKESLNRKLLFHTSEILKKLGAEIQFIDLKELNLPIFDQDLEDESGMPPAAQRLVDAILVSDAVVIGNPEYNGGITGALKNAIDWASRSKINPFVSRLFMLVGTSPGVWGAVKSNFVTRHILTHLRAIVLPAQITIPKGGESLTENGSLKDSLQEKLLESACADLLKMVSALKQK